MSWENNVEAYRKNHPDEGKKTAEEKEGETA